MSSPPPPYSCRSGLAMCFLGGSHQSYNGPEAQPFRLTMEPRRVEGGEAVNITTMRQLSMEEAMDERRLSVVLDETGVVISVSASPESLFGFSPGGWARGGGEWRRVRRALWLGFGPGLGLPRGTSCGF